MKHTINRNEWSWFHLAWYLWPIRWLLLQRGPYHVGYKDEQPFIFGGTRTTSFQSLSNYRKIWIAMFSVNTPASCFSSPLSSVNNSMNLDTFLVKFLHQLIHYHESNKSLLNIFLVQLQLMNMCILLTSTNKNKINNNKEYDNHTSKNCIFWYFCHQHLDCCDWQYCDCDWQYSDGHCHFDGQHLGGQY